MIALWTEPMPIFSLAKLTEIIPLYNTHQAEIGSLGTSEPAVVDVGAPIRPTNWGIIIGAATWSRRVTNNSADGSRNH